MILYSQEFTEELSSALGKADSSCFIASAFIKANALLKLSESFSSNLGSISVVARWRKHDIAAGASDLEAFEICRRNGWRFGVDCNLHGKIYLIDESEIFLGSANLTQRGLMLHGPGNHEFGTKLPIDSVDLAKVHSFIRSEVVWMTDDLYADIKSEIDSIPASVNKLSDLSWSSELASRIDKPAEFLWVEDLLFLGPEKLLRLNLNSEDCRHDFETLDLDLDDICEASLKAKFRRTKIYQWLSAILREEDSVSFGRLSSQLHKRLMNEPSPYRKQVKEYVQVIFQWCEFMEEDFSIEKFARTSAISLTSS